MAATEEHGEARPRAPRNLFAEQGANRRTTWLLVAGFVLFLAFLGFGFDLFVLGYDATRPLSRGNLPIPIAAALATLVGGTSAFFGYRFGDRAVLASSGARLLRPDDPNARVLMNVVTEMAIASGLPMPKVYVLDDPDPNAFATGRDPEHASIAVTTGLLMVMNRDELQGVIAHEMSHIRNYDIRTMMVVAALLGAVLLLSEWASRVRLRARGRGDDDGGRISLPAPLMLLVFLVWLLAIVLAPLIGQILATAVSRSREYLADASGAELTRNPMGLANALRKLAAATEPTRRVARGTAHLCITDPLERAVNEREGAWADLLATHPPIQERVARLEQMAYRA
ncbi:MAG: M48 family metallopeptidase [Candidatus Rokubacteria bacterium]|nr:M48 family metallopeptidase [Candidatus Rokubacteria bacterium]